MGRLRRGVKCIFGSGDLVRHTLVRDSCAGRGRLGGCRYGRHLRFLKSTMLRLMSDTCLFGRFPGMSRKRLAGAHTDVMYRPSLTVYTESVKLKSCLLLKGKRRTANKEGESSVASSTVRTLVNTVCLSNNFAGTGRFVRRFVLASLRSGGLFCSDGAVLRRVIRTGVAKGMDCRLVSRRKPSRGGVFRIRTEVKKGS